jgi:hypothetical protein
MIWDHHPAAKSFLAKDKSLASLKGNAKLSKKT